MSIECLPEIDEEDQRWLSYNPNTSDIVDWVRNYAAKAVADALPRIQWPAGRDAGRAEDMGEGHLRVVLDSDNDVCVSVWDGDRSATVEFCNPGGGGGGRSSRTRLALIALMIAIEADNADRPSLQRPRTPRAA